MGDGKVQRIAVILGGEVYDHTLPRAAKRFEEKGYDLYIASAWNRKTNAFFYQPPNSRGVEAVVETLEGAVDDDDDIVIFFGAHGEEEGDGCLILEDTCLPKDHPIFQRLSALPHGKRTVIMGTCFGGNWTSLFAKDHQTLFVSAGARGEHADYFMGYFMFDSENKIRDINHDGTITWQERYRHSMRKHGPMGLSFFAPNVGYRDTGLGGTNPEPAHFKPRLHTAKSFQDYKKLLKRVKPGDVAVVEVLAPGYKRCKKHHHKFKEWMNKTKGRALFISIPNGTKSEWKSLEVSDFPAMLLVDDRGGQVKIDGRHDPLTQRWKMTDAKLTDRRGCLRRLWHWSESDEATRIPSLFWRERQFVREAVIRGGLSVLEHAPDGLKNSIWRDRHLVLEAVQLNGLSGLEHAPDGLKNFIWRDRYVIFQAVNDKGLSALEHAPDGLKDIIKVVKVGEWSVLIMTNAVHQRHPDLLQAVQEHYFRDHYKNNQK